MNPTNIGKRRESRMSAGVLSKDDAIQRACRIVDEVQGYDLLKEDVKALASAALGDCKPHKVLYEPKSDDYSLASVLLAMLSISEQSKSEVVALWERRVLRVWPNESMKSLMERYST